MTLCKKNVIKQRNDCIAIYLYAQMFIQPLKQKTHCHTKASLDRGMMIMKLQQT